MHGADASGRLWMHKGTKVQIPLLFPPSLSERAAPKSPNQLILSSPSLFTSAAAEAIIPIRRT